MPALAHLARPALAHLARPALAVLVCLLCFERVDGQKKIALLVRSVDKLKKKQQSGFQIKESLRKGTRLQETSTRGVYSLSKLSKT